MRGEQVGLLQCEWHVARAEKGRINTLLTHRLSLNCAESAGPLLAESSHPGSIFQIERPHSDRVATVEVLAKFQSNVVVHAVLQTIIRSRFQRSAATSLLPAYRNAGRVDRRLK